MGQRWERGRAPGKEGRQEERQWLVKERHGARERREREREKQKKKKEK